ncbi:MAG: hypothetical protein H6721_13745 [Sandaracinus sp.]|nr:hypothetical protein [Sandaracinus sp.]MCB9633179.1 hypothetical protein [Sandaracinus sp.]
MTRSTLLLTLLFLGPIAYESPARADLPCHEGGQVAQSPDGSVEVHASPHGCRQHPSPSLTVRLRGADLYTVRAAPDFHRVSVSSTGRTLLVQVSEHLRGDRDSLWVYRDGYRLGVYRLADLLGAESRAVREGRHVEVRIEGVELVIADVDGTELHRRYLGALPYHRAP